jgi:hypothetical protein
MKLMPHQGEDGNFGYCKFKLKGHPVFLGMAFCNKV